jgi:hypothetical protein
MNVNELRSWVHANPLTISASYTGITVLKKMPAAYVCRNNTGIRITKEYEIIHKKRFHVEHFTGELNFEQKKSQRITTNAGTDTINRNKGQPTTNKYYTINAKEIRNRVYAYVDTLQQHQRLYFYTITFPKNISDNTAYKAFNIWLTKLRTRKIIEPYVWVAERQKNGTIHYHMLSNIKEHITKVNGYMTKTLSGYVRKGLINWSQSECAKYNGVDIAKNRETKQIINFALPDNLPAVTYYITSYMSKSEQKFTHLAWHNSREYSRLFTSIKYTYEQINTFISTKQLNYNKIYDTNEYTFIPYAGNVPTRIRTDLKNINITIKEIPKEQITVDISKQNKTIKVAYKTKQKIKMIEKHYGKE